MNYTALCSHPTVNGCQNTSLRVKMGRFMLFLSFLVALFVIFIPPTLSQTNYKFEQPDQLNGSNCIPFPRYRGDFTSGYHVPACANILREHGYSHFWAGNDDLYQPPIEGMFGTNTPTLLTPCATETFFKFEAPAQRLLNSFEVDVPSTMCQNVLMLTSCLYMIPVCDPDIDKETYITKDQHKPCSWLCEILRNNIDELCTDEDITHLKKVNLDLKQLEGSDTDIDKSPWYVPFQCTSDRYVQQSSIDEMGTPCIAPASISNKVLSARCETYSGSLCTGMFGSGTQIYIPGGSTQDQMENEVSIAAFALNALPRDDVSSCPSDIVHVFCASIYRECLNFGVTHYKRGPDGYPDPADKGIPTKKALPLNPTHESCTSYVDHCNDTEMFKTYRDIFFSGGDIANCDSDEQYNTAYCIPQDRQGAVTVASSYAFNTKNFFAKNQYTTTLLDGPDGSLYLSHSFAASSNVLVESIPYMNMCPDILVMADESTPDVNTIFGATGLPTQCAFPCPTPIYDKSDRDRIEVATWVFVMFSLIATTILLITFTVFKSQRHKRLLFWFIFSYFCVVFLLFLGLIVRTDGELWAKQCSSPTEYQHNHGFGLFQGMLLVYFFCATASWWLMQAIDMYQRLILGLHQKRNSPNAKKRSIAMHLFCWLNPLFVVAGCLVAEQIGYDGHLPFAFITSHSSMIGKTSNGRSMMVLFFAQILLSFCIGIILIGIVLVYLWKYSNQSDGLKKVQDQIDEDKGSKLHKTRVFIKLFGFSLLMLPFFIILCTFYAYRGNREILWRDAKIAWGRELIFKSDGFNLLTEAIVNPLNEKMPVWMIILTTFAFTSVGFMIFILHFVLSSDVYGLWLGIFYYKCGIQCCSKWAKEDTDTWSNGSSSGGSSNHSGGSTGPSKGSTQQSNTTTHSSGDIFGGTGVLLTKKARANAARDNHNTNGDSNGSLGATNASLRTGNGNNNGSSGAEKSICVSPTSPDSTMALNGVGNLALQTGGGDLTSSGSPKPPQVRRETLFKGMSKKSEDRRALPKIQPSGSFSNHDFTSVNSLHSVHSNHSANNSFTSEQCVEMASYGDNVDVGGTERRNIFHIAEEAEDYEA